MSQTRNQVRYQIYNDQACNVKHQVMNQLRTQVINYVWNQICDQIPEMKMKISRNYIRDIHK